MSKKNKSKKKISKAKMKSRFFVLYARQHLNAVRNIVVIEMHVIVMIVKCAQKIKVGEKNQKKILKLILRKLIIQAKEDRVHLMALLQVQKKEDIAVGNPVRGVRALKKVEEEKGNQNEEDQE